eukprot:11569518-Ditylum_brightwellii.AAC.1
MLIASRASVAPAVPRPNSIARDLLMCEWGVFTSCLPPIRSNTSDELTKGTKSLSVSPEFASHSKITSP